VSYGAGRRAANGVNRVLMVTPRFLPHAGGIQTHVREVGERLVRAGVTVDVLTTDPAGDLPAEETIDGLSVHRVPAWPRTRDYYLAPRMWSFITRGQWDVVHCQGVHTFVAPLAMAAARQARVPYVVSFHTGGHSSALRARARSIQWKALSPLLARACRLVAVSRYEGDLFRRIVRPRGGQLVVIPNGVTRGSTEEGVSRSGEPLILSVGRLERYKGHHRLIEAMPHVLSEVGSARALIVGAGPYQLELQDLITGLGLEDRVSITAVPAGDREAMGGLLSQAALVVLLSDYEAHPVALLEAASMGRPILVSRTSGLTELVESGMARGVAAEASTSEIGLAIVESLRNPVTPDAVVLPSWDDTTSALLAEYRACVSRRR
jgi:glycosyltransferase involved in cell wall biosynthesis